MFSVCRICLYGEVTRRIGRVKILRIAQVVETLDAGGAEGLAVDIANALAARGHQSHLIVLDGRGPFRQRVKDQVHFTDLALPRRNGSFVSNALYFRNTLKILSRLLKDNGVVVVQTHLPKSNFLGLFLGKNRVARVYPTVHNNREFDYGANSNRMKELMRKRAYRQMLSWCSAMIAVSGQVRTAMIGELKIGKKMSDRLVVIPNGVAIPSALEAGERSKVREHWSVGEEEILMVAAGRLTRQKNFSSLIEALALVPEDCGPWKCVIAGEGELQDVLAADISARGLDDKILLAGYVSEIGGLLGAADIFCLSSLFEGLPLVLLEAMAAGLPICAYGIDGVVDVVQDGVQAKLARPEDPASLAESIHFLLAHPVERRKMGFSGRDLVQSRFNFGRVVDQLEELFKA